LSDRPTTCSAASGSEVVIGCTDHALYIVDTDKAKRKRTLYNSCNGHSECVPGVHMHHLRAEDREVEWLQK
jgi:hypothetical protein